jgi:hypothetical protein
LQLCRLKNIKILITERLIILNIGDCDIYSFRELIKFLTSYKFYKVSSLENMNISLLNCIIANEIKNLLYEIFSIKLNHLIELNIYSNIYKNKESYVNSIYNFKNNWISKCGLILNPKSEIFMNSIENENQADIK